MPDTIAALPRPRTWPDLDRTLHAAEARATSALSPVAVSLAYADWAMNLANAPFRRTELYEQALGQWGRLARAALGETVITPPPQDRRFAHPSWEGAPYKFLTQCFLLAEEWLGQVSDAGPGVAARNAALVRFLNRQILDAFSPSNVPWLNPEVLTETVRSGGENLRQGLRHFMADQQAALSGVAPPSPLAVGRDLACTPGKVVFRNELIELIQYAPVTDRVAREPVLIVPAWIMKYYILDLSPQNSLVRFLVQNGHTVFAISWRNPGPELAQYGMEEYRVQGVMAALDAVCAIVPEARVQAAGYCLGGTLLAIAAAAMARDGDDRLATVSLFAAQTDFTEAGELQLFISDAQLAFLEDVMTKQGYLDSRNMAGAFTMLRSNDLYWSRLINAYWLGRRDAPNDMMAWNADATRMPARMHGEYLRSMFLNNDLTEGRFLAGGRPVAVRDLRMPLFVVGTETDHVAPWRSVYKIELLTEAETTFVLTTGGHNAGIVSEPGHPHRNYRMLTRMPGSVHLDPESFLQRAERREGSWWPAWREWLATHNGHMVKPPMMGNAKAGLPPLGDAPGKYVLEH